MTAMHDVYSASAGLLADEVGRPMGRLVGFSAGNQGRAVARPGLRNHPKFRRLVATLGEPRPHVVGYLESMWEVVYEAGNPLIGDEVDVILAAEYPHPDRAGAFVKALETCGGAGRSGFIERNGQGLYEIHDLYDHAPEYVQRRMEREATRTVRGQTISDVRRAAAQKRWEKAGNANDCNRPTLAYSQDANGATPAPAPAPAPAPTTPQSPPAGKVEVEEEWFLVLCRLRQIVVDAGSAIRDARKNGLAPQDVIGIIDHYLASPGAWNPGGLHYRVRTGTQGESPDHGWPPPAIDFSDAKRAAEAAAARLAYVAEQEKAKAESDERARLLERDYGPVLDAMTQEQIDELAAASPPLDGDVFRGLVRKQRKRNGHDKPTGIVRDQLLTAIQKRGAP